MAKPDFQLKWGVDRVGGIPVTDPADYKLGWQYRAGLPPLTGNFDYVHNLADQRLLYINEQGIIEWDVATAYPEAAYVKGSDGEIYRSTAPTTGNDPIAGGPWILAISDTLNTVRQDVASAATVVLPTTTRHVNITGTTAITAFTIAAGNCYFVRFAAAATLTNNASIVTQTGANIVAAAGDTCIIRATATDVVEVLCYTDANLRRVVSVGSNANGRWRLWDDGFLEQWGAVVTISGAASVNADFTFPVSYTNQGSIKVVASIGVGVTDLDSSPQYRGDKQSLNIATPTISGCEAQAFLESNTADVRHMSWYSRGY